MKPPTYQPTNCQPTNFLCQGWLSHKPDACPKVHWGFHTFSIRQFKRAPMPAESFAGRGRTHKVIRIPTELGRPPQNQPGALLTPDFFVTGNNGLTTKKGVYANPPTTHPCTPQQVPLQNTPELNVTSWVHKRYLGICPSVIGLNLATWLGPSQ